MEDQGKVPIRFKDEPLLNSVCKESYGTHAFRYRNLHAFDDDCYFNFQSPVFPASGKVKSEISSLFLRVSPPKKKVNPSKEGFLFFRDSNHIIFSHSF